MMQEDPYTYKMIHQVMITSLSAVLVQVALLQVRDGMNHACDETSGSKTPRPRVFDSQNL